MSDDKKLNRYKVALALYIAEYTNTLDDVLSHHQEDIIRRVGHNDRCRTISDVKRMIRCMHRVMPLRKINKDVRNAIMELTSQ